MSGGVDSSVTAALLKQKGYDVVGLTMKLFDNRTAASAGKIDRGCCNLDALQRAEAVCHTLKIPHYSLDLMGEFKQYVIEDFVEEYLAGRTPNPCIRCNTYLKWGFLFHKAEMLGCGKLATGHYARIEKRGDDVQLLRAQDPSKEQSYALWGIPKDKLDRTILPLGSFNKKSVRKFAAELGLKSAQTPDSQEICFVPDGHYAEFLRARRPEFFDDLESGELVQDEDGRLERIGEHPGYPFYTVGQRRGLGGGYPAPRYVVKVNPASNRVIIGPRERLFSKAFIVDQVNWLIPIPADPIKADVQIRYNSKAEPAAVIPGDAGGSSSGEECTVRFDQPIEAITPGQSAVFYIDNERLVGGGRIQTVLDQ